MSTASISLCKRIMMTLVAVALACGVVGMVGCSGDAPAEATVPVTVNIDATAADGELTTYDVKVPEGGTVHDALMATGVEVNETDSEYGAYIESIAGLANGDHGEMSGWVFEVNSEYVPEAASEAELVEGDVVDWIYWV